jgi:hypothetical protein
MAHNGPRLGLRRLAAQEALKRSRLGMTLGVSVFL